jgi:hypothetical protein
MFNGRDWLEDEGGEAQVFKSQQKLNLSMKDS